MSMNIVLVHPEIPQNTGNIARTCAATGTVLHLIEPLGFSLDDRYLKRAGLDYWHLMEYHVYRDEEDFLRQHPGTGTTWFSGARPAACRKTCCGRCTTAASEFPCAGRPGA